MGGNLKRIVEELSGKTSRQRFRIVRNCLASSGFHFFEQTYDFGHTNLLVDIRNEDIGREGPSRKKFLLASHYDTVPNSPGANDNASAVAVLLSVAEHYKESGAAVPLRLAFFDQEEEKLKGSRAYVKQYGIDDLSAVLNMELVGQGLIPLFWPEGKQSDFYKSVLAEAAGEAHFASYVGRHTGDHLSFLEAGLNEAICLTLVRVEDRNSLKFIESRKKERTGSTIGSMVDSFKILKTIKDSQTLRTYHTSKDTPDYIKEESLQLAKRIILRAVGFYARDTGY